MLVGQPDRIGNPVTEGHGRDRCVLIDRRRARSAVNGGSPKSGRLGAARALMRAEMLLDQGDVSSTSKSPPTASTALAGA